MLTRIQAAATLKEHGAREVIAIVVSLNPFAIAFMPSVSEQQLTLPPDTRYSERKFAVGEYRTC